VGDFPKFLLVLFLVAGEPSLFVEKLLELTQVLNEVSRAGPSQFLALDQVAILLVLRIDPVGKLRLGLILLEAHEVLLEVRFDPSLVGRDGAVLSGRLAR